MVQQFFTIERFIAIFFGIGGDGEQVEWEQHNYAFKFFRINGLFCPAEHCRIIEFVL
jgi:hypothetical protein